MRKNDYVINYENLEALIDSGVLDATDVFLNVFTNYLGLEILKDDFMEYVNTEIKGE